MNQRKWIKLGLSVFVIYHLFVVLTVPNPQSYLTREVASFILPYANTLSINTPWQFFSPEPSSYVYYEYEVIPDSLDEEMKTYQWPPKDRSEYLIDNYMRLIYHSRFSTSSEQRIHQFFLPWLCRYHPEAREITMRIMSEELVSLDKAVIVGGPLSNLLDIRTWNRIPYNCERGSEE